MGHLRQLDSNADPQAFPGALFQISGEVPATQCSEAPIEGTTGRLYEWQKKLFSEGSFTNFSLPGKYCVILSPPLVAGTYTITSNDNDTIWTTYTFEDSVYPVSFYIRNGPAFILTRNAESFAQYIHNLGYAYTIKAGTLYTDMPANLLKDACSILFAPQT